LTTEYAAGAVYVLSLMSHSDPLLAAIAGPIVAVILMAKPLLQRFIGRIQPAELQTALLLLLLAVAAALLSEDALASKWTIFDPRVFVLLMLALGTLEFTGYLLARAAEPKRGALILGLLGGFVSSTAVLIYAAKESGRPQRSKFSLVAMVLASQFSSLAELAIVVALVSPVLLAHMMVPMAAAMTISLSLAAILSYLDGGAQRAVEMQSPLHWKSVIRLAFVFALGPTLVGVLMRAFGDNAAAYVSVLGGAFELQGVSFANASVFAHGSIPIETASTNILTAISASFVSKALFSVFLVRNKFSLSVNLIFALMIASLWIAVGLW
jgi:uncharacterized membrane protein (DUF4010 family)